MSNFKNKYTDSEKKIVEDWLDINSIENVKEVMPDNTAYHDTKIILNVTNVYLAITFFH